MGKATRIIALASALLAACGSGNDGSGGALLPPSADLSGSWAVSETINGNCAGVSYPEINTYTATITQVGNDLWVVNDATGDTLTGVISANSVTLSLISSDAGGTLTGTFPGTVSDDGNAFGGLGTFDWTNSTHTTTCGGTSRLAASRASTAFPAPTGVSARAGYAQVTLSWTESIGATRYEIRRSTVAGGAASGTLVMTAYAQTSSTMLRRLTNGTTYYFVVTAYNAAGQPSPASAEVSATPLDSYPRPATPTGVVATAGAGSVTVSCNPVAGATKYYAYMSLTAGQLATFSGSWTARSSNGCTGITFPLLTPSTPYYFVVTAWTLDGESAPSPEVSATPL